VGVPKPFLLWCDLSSGRLRLSVFDFQRRT
jgi:hypothetical protein